MLVKSSTTTKTSPRGQISNLSSGKKKGKKKERLTKIRESELDMNKRNRQVIEDEEANEPEFTGRC
jgi:hypothetical protein